MAESKVTSKRSKDKKEKKAQKDTSDDDSSSLSSVSQEDKSLGQIGQGIGTASITINREEYLLAYKDLIFDRNHLQIRNNLLHRRLAEYYKKRKLEHVLKPIENVPHMEEKYQQKLFSFQELKEKEDFEMADIKAKINTVEAEYAGKLEQAEKNFDNLQHNEKSIGTGLIYSKKGKPIADKTVQRFLTLQRRKSEQASALRLRYIRARNAVNELETTVRKLEIIAPGLNVAQYEQLHIDNQNYLSKIEEREDELIKNRANCTEHNQMLAHIREKMHHTDEVIDFAECDLGDAEIELLRAREDLGNIKIYCARNGRVVYIFVGKTCGYLLPWRGDQVTLNFYRLSPTYNVDLLPGAKDIPHMVPLTQLHWYNCSDKGRRDKLRWSLEAERVKAGLLTRKDLLRDFQDATDEVVKLREKKKELEHEISVTTKKLRDARQRMQIQPQLSM